MGFKLRKNFEIIYANFFHLSNDSMNKFYFTFIHTDLYSQVAYAYACAICMDTEFFPIDPASISITSFSGFDSPG